MRMLEISRSTCGISNSNCTNNRSNNLQPATMARADLPFMLTVTRSSCSLYCEPARTSTKIDLVQGHSAQTCSLINLNKMKSNLIITVARNSTRIYIIKQCIYNKVMFKIRKVVNIKFNKLILRK